MTAKSAKLWTTLLATSLVFGPYAFASEAPASPVFESPELESRFPTASADNYLRGQIEEHNIPGIAVSVIRDGEIVYLGAFGVQRGQTAVNDETQFHSASISKLLTATAVMQLVEAGSLSLDQSLSEILPTFDDPRITIRLLLTHQAGFANKVRARRTTDRSANADYLQNVWKRGLSYKPGSRWRYNDADYNILGAVVSKVSGLPFDQYVDQRIFTPLGMTNSSFFLPDVKPEHRAAPHRGKSAKLVEQHPYDFNFAPSSGLQTTARDLAIFLAAHTERTSKLLVGDSYDLMQQASVQTDISGIAQGLGWQVLESPSRPTILQHGGSDRGFRALVSIRPESRTGIVILSNGENTPRWEISAGMQRFLETAEIAD